MKRAQLFIIIILAALAPRCDDMGHDALKSLGGFRYMIKDRDPWSMRLGGAENDYGYAITSDRSKNIIVAGKVHGNADLNGIGGIELGLLPEDTAAAFEDCYGSNTNDIFISKFNSSGNAIWAKRLGGLEDADTASDIATDSGNNIVVVGTIANDADINGDGDNDDGGAEDSESTTHDMFIAKFDSSGTHLWARRIGGFSTDAARGVTIDHEDRIIITGNVMGDADLNDDGDYDDDGEPGNPFGSQDIFISCFTSSGGYLWSKRMGGIPSAPGGADYGYSITHDSMNNVIVTGYVTGKADLNGDGDTDDSWEDPSGIPGNPYGDTDIFISKYDSAGTHLWSRRLGGVAEDWCYRIKVDDDDSVFITGYIEGNADLSGDGDIDDSWEDLSTLPVNPYGGKDIVLSKFDSSGTHLWARRLGGTLEDNGCGLAVSGGTVILTGMVTGNADLNGDGDVDDGGAENEGIYGAGDVFIAAFNRNGEALWSQRLGSEDNIDESKSITINGSGDIIVAGHTWGDADLNGDGDVIDEYEVIESGVQGQYDVFFTVFPKNNILFFP